MIDRIGMPAARYNAVRWGGSAAACRPADDDGLHHCTTLVDRIDALIQTRPA
jgi:hypothetical protein